MGWVRIKGWGLDWGFDKPHYNLTPQESNVKGKGKAEEFI